MTTDSPFFLAKVECPICKTINEFETVRMGAYVEEGRDSDFCPRDIKWRYPKYDGYNPLVFFVATCSNCFYSREFTPAFKDWKADSNFRTYRLRVTKDKHLEQLSTADSVVKRLGAAIDMGRFPNQSAILKLHMAVFDEQLFEHHSKLDLGRFYLRIAWVYRSIGSTVNPQVSRMRGFTHELETRYDGINDTLRGTRDKVGEFVEAVRKEFGADRTRPIFAGRYCRIRIGSSPRPRSWTGARLDRRALDRAAQSDRGVQDCRRGARGHNSEPMFAGFGSFAEFLYDLGSGTASSRTNARRWPRRCSTTGRRSLRDVESPRGTSRIRPPT